MLSQPSAAHNKTSETSQAHSTAREGWTMQNLALLLGRLVLAYLYFTQLFWKMPPTFGCPPDFTFTTGSFDGGRVTYQRSTGLCDWIGIEAVWSEQPRPFFVANIDNRSAPEIAVDLGWAARLNGAFLESIVMPNIRWFGYVIWWGEAIIFGSLFIGLFSRLGGLIAIGISAQLMIGLGGIPNPFEWEWTYNMLVMLSILMFAFAPGRFFGLDAWLRPRLQAAAEKGNGPAKILCWLT